MKSRLAALAEMRSCSVLLGFERFVRRICWLACRSKGNFAIAKGRNIGAFRHIDPDAVMLAGSQIVVLE